MRGRHSTQKRVWGVTWGRRKCGLAQGNWTYKSTTFWIKDFFLSPNDTNTRLKIALGLILESTHALSYWWFYFLIRRLSGQTTQHFHTAYWPLAGRSWFQQTTCSLQYDVRRPPLDSITSDDCSLQYDVDLSLCQNTAAAAQPPLPSSDLLLLGAEHGKPSSWSVCTLNETMRHIKQMIVGILFKYKRELAPNSL